jgi:hypothetical protein
MAKLPQARETLQQVCGIVSQACETSPQDSRNFRSLAKLFRKGMEQCRSFAGYFCKRAGLFRSLAGFFRTGFGLRKIIPKRPRPVAGQFRSAASQRRAPVVIFGSCLGTTPTLRDGFPKPPTSLWEEESIIGKNCQGFGSFAFSSTGLSRVYSPPPRSSPYSCLAGRDSTAREKPRYVPLNRRSADIAVRPAASTPRGRQECRRSKRGSWVG